MNKDKTESASPNTLTQGGVLKFCATSTDSGVSADQFCYISVYNLEAIGEVVLTIYTGQLLSLKLPLPALCGYVQTTVMSVKEEETNGGFDVSTVHVKNDIPIFGGEESEEDPITQLSSMLLFLFVGLASSLIIVYKIERTIIGI